MELSIFNTLTGEKVIHPILSKEIRIGRNPKETSNKSSNDLDGIQQIILSSKIVSKHHLTLHHAENAWLLKHLGTNDTFVNEQEVSHGQLLTITSEDEVKFGEFLLNLGMDKVSQEFESPEQEIKLLELEKSIHEQLLSALDLRRSGASINLDDEVTKNNILRFLNDIVANRSEDLTDNDIKTIARTAILRKLTREVTAVGGKTSKSSWDYSIAFNSASLNNQLKDLLNKIASRLNLTMDKKSLEEDCKIIDTKFDDIYKNYELEFSQGVYRDIAESFIKKNILDLIFGLGPLQDLMEMDSVSEVMVVSRDKIFIEKFGIVEDSRRKFISDSLLLATIERIVSPIGRRIDKSSPMVDAHLPDGSRVNAVIPPLALKGPCLTIRKFSQVPLTIDNLIEFGALTKQVSKFLHSSVEGRKNIIISGGTGSGKTTLLNCVSAYIPRKERIVTIEDTAELQLKQEHVVSLESRPANMEGKGEISIRDLVKNALRMRPDRVVVGECRGAEALDMLQAMNTGHDGSMTTGHANSAQDMMRRLEVMVLTGTDMPVSAIREQIISALDLVVQLNRLSDGSRKITQISEVIGIDEQTGQVITEDIFKLKQVPNANSQIYHTGYIPTFVQDLLDKNIMSLDTFF